MPEGEQTPISRWLQFVIVVGLCAVTSAVLTTMAILGGEADCIRKTNESYREGFDNGVFWSRTVDSEK